MAMGRRERELGCVGLVAEWPQVRQLLGCDGKFAWGGLARGLLHEVLQRVSWRRQGPHLQLVVQFGGAWRLQQVRPELRAWSLPCGGALLTPHDFVCGGDRVCTGWRSYASSGEGSEDVRVLRRSSTSPGLRPWSFAACCLLMFVAFARSVCAARRLIWAIACACGGSGARDPDDLRFSLAFCIESVVQCDVSERTGAERAHGTGVAILDLALMYS